MLTQRGFTIIELMITVAVVAILLMAGLPSFNSWMSNMRIRSAAEAVQNGLQLARATAIGRNTQVSLVFPTDGDGSYIVYSVVSPSAMPPDFRAPTAGSVNIAKTYNQAEGSANATVTLTPNDAYMVTFSSMGQVVINPDGSSVPTQIDVGGVGVDPALRPLRIQVSAGGSTKTCDPAVSDTTDPRHC